MHHVCMCTSVSSLHIFNHFFLSLVSLVSIPGIYVQVAQKLGLFEWQDGIVVQAMQEGCCLLIDEISLAEDAVLERLNSVLERERKLLVSEKSRTGQGEIFEITATEGFVFMATMNPGGDYGKKEVCLCSSSSV